MVRGKVAPGLVTLFFFAACASKPATRVDARPPEGPRCVAVGQPREKPVDLVFVSKLDDFMFRVPYSADWQYRCERVTHLNDRADNVFEARWTGGGGWEISVNVVTESRQDSTDDAHAYLERIAKDLSQVTAMKDGS